MCVSCPINPWLQLHLFGLHLLGFILVDEDVTYSWQVKLCLNPLHYCLMQGDVAALSNLKRSVNPKQAAKIITINHT